MRIIISSVLLIVILQITLSTGCEQYSLRTVSLTKCRNWEQIINIDPDFDIELQPDCDLVPRGCIQYEGFTTGTVHYTVTLNGRQMVNDNADICSPQALKSPLLQSIMPQNCTGEKRIVCFDKSKAYNINKFKALLPMGLGTTVLQVYTQHDTGRSCFRYEVQLSRRKGGFLGII